jgi:DNA-directed RNA polymerase subunit RPC12/RpoP
MSDIFGSGGNLSRIGKLQRDSEGNVLQCPHCGSTHLIKAGHDGTTKNAPQRYRCKDCNKKTVNPLIAKSAKIDNSAAGLDVLPNPWIYGNKSNAQIYKDEWDLWEEFMCKEKGLKN